MIKTLNIQKKFVSMPRCKHCRKYFKKGNGKCSLKRHLAAVKAANKKKLNSKSVKSKTNTDNKTKTKKRNGKTQSQIAKEARSKNERSEKNFVKKLVGRGFFTFRTGQAYAVPDIVAYKNRKLSFYEIKPAHSKATAKTLLMKHQYDWMKKFCLNKKIEVNLVFYTGSQSFKYSVVRITKKNIEDFVYNAKNAYDIFDRTDELTYK